ncbi:MAG: hypothetical protein BWY41_01752 [Candidatus Atribacteria bacterium ADurb.Bin276]|uniref:Uncharacterized protein n=1 Tax=Candidatus Atribacter allofermentans TaxID=1852833 RepID=A0A1V5SLG1_9BACT|nr:MAG: hypothetical protein BWY41_01752 [Candidatus Atribacteria bacterium ADurb.Bin276]
MRGVPEPVAEEMDGVACVGHAYIIVYRIDGRGRGDDDLLHHHQAVDRLGQPVARHAGRGLFGHELAPAQDGDDDDAPRRQNGTSLHAAPP